MTLGRSGKHIPIPLGACFNSMGLLVRGLGAFRVCSLSW